MRLIDIIDIQRYVRTCAAKANLTVVYEDTNVPYCTPGRVHLPNISKFTTDEELEQYLYFIEHEGAHAAHSDFDVIGRYKNKSFTSRVLNIVEDYRIDNKDARWYDGFRANRAGVVPPKAVNVAESYRKFCESDKATPEQIDEGARYMALLEWSLRNDETGAIQAEHEAMLVNDSVRQWADKLAAYDDRLRSVIDGETGDAADLVETLMREVFDHDSEPDKTPEPQDGEGGGDNGGNEQGEGEGQGEGDDGDGDGQEGKSPGKPKVKKGKPDGGEGFGNHFDHQSGGKQGIATHHNYDEVETRKIEIDYYATDWVPCLPSDYNVVNLAEGATSMSKVFARAESVYDQDISAITLAKNQAVAKVRKIESSTVDGFAQQVRRLLQIRARSRYEFGQKKGKLDQARLSRLAMRDVPGFNERVFKRKIVADTTDTAVMVLLDASGSMSGSKWAHAMKSAELLNATISRALGIPVEILAFTDDEQGSVIYEGKRFNELRVGDDELLSRLGLCTSYMSGNADGEAIAFAYHRLRQRKEKRKVMIVCSDGAPSSSDRETSGGGRIDEYTKEVIKDIEADPHVDIYGLGIMSTSVCEFYKHHVVVNSGDSLEQALLTLIDKSIA